MSGAIGSVQLKKLPNFLKNRRQNAKIFKTLFENEENIIIQKETHESSWFGFSLILKNNLDGYRDQLINQLKESNIECRPIVAGDFTKNPVIKYLDHRISNELNDTKIIDENGFFVGNDFRNLSEEINHLHSTIKEFESTLVS